VSGSRLDQSLVLFLGCALLFGVVYLVVGTGHESASPPRAATSQVATTAPVASVPATTLYQSEPPTRTDTHSLPFNGPRTTSTSHGQGKPSKRAVQAIVRFRITAARGSSWVLVRAGSSAGRVLYSGILNQGQTISFRGRVLWLSFGAAANLDAQLNGSPLELGTGTYDARIGRRGLLKVPFGTIRSP
jgi:Domain of unknown function (DUF4115)